MSVGSIFFLRSLQSLTAPVLIVSNPERSSNKNTSLSLFPFSTLPHQGRRSLYTGHNQVGRGLVLSEYSQPQDQGLHGPCLFQRGGSWRKKSWFEKDAFRVKSFEDDLRSLTNLPSQPIELSLASSRLPIQIILMCYLVNPRTKPSNCPGDFMPSGRKKTFQP